MTKIAIITPCYNRANYISECVKSVSLSNTFGKFGIEHILVDDASTDNTWEVLNQLKTADIKVFQLKENRGPSFARNFAIDHSNADFIFCLDSDDVLFQNSLYSLLNFALEKKVDWVYGDIVRGDQELRYQIGDDFFGWNFKTIEDILVAMYKNEHFFQHSSLFSRSAFIKVGQYDNSRRIEEEFDLFTRMLLCGFFPHYLPAPLFIYRVHKNNISGQYSKNIQNHKNSLRELYGKYQSEFKRILPKNSITNIEETQSAW
jgi:glycosyltransferase involved in cell wall biosynthesis